MLVSGKGSGHYGCYNAKRKTCNNNLNITRKSIEEVIATEPKERILTRDNLDYVYREVEKLASQSLNDAPELVKKKRGQHEKLPVAIGNYLNFIKSGNFSKALSDALAEAEKRNAELKQEVESLESQKKNGFKVPPREWIDHKLKNLRETLRRDSVSALVLKELLGPISLEPISNKEDDHYRLFGGEDGDFNPFYMAHAKVRTPALLDEGNQGANWLHWRRGGDLNPRWHLRATSV